MSSVVNEVDATIDDLLDEGPDSDLAVDNLPDAWVRSVFFGTAGRQVTVRCVFCTKDHGHEWAYEAGDRDPGPRVGGCKRGRYFVRIRRAARERSSRQTSTR